MIRILSPQSRRQRETLRVAGPARPDKGETVALRDTRTRTDRRSGMSMAAVLILVVTAGISLSAAEFDQVIPCGWQRRSGSG